MSDWVIVVVEGLPDQEVARKLVRESGLSLRGEPLVKRGKGNIDKNLSKYNKSSRSLSWLIIRDLDHDAECPPQLKRNLLPRPEKKMCFCIAVREIESWLMADIEKFAEFMSVPETEIHLTPESLSHPKSEVVRLSGISTNPDIRNDMTPEPGSIRKEGPAYASRLAEFASNYWRPSFAADRADSLKYCMKKLRALKVLC